MTTPSVTIMETGPDLRVVDIQMSESFARRLIDALFVISDEQVPYSHGYGELASLRGSLHMAVLDAEVARS